MIFHALRSFLNAIQKMTALCLVMFLFTTPAYASWTIQNSGVSNDLFAVNFPVNANTGFAVGTGGTILKTTNAGSSWKKMNSGVRDNLTDVSFIDDQTGYVTGVNGTILKTTNGGTSWSKLNSGTTQHLLTVHFPVDTNTGYVGGNVSTLLKTINGGQTWTPLTINGGYVYDIVFPQNASTGYVSAIDGSQDYIYKTTDGGLNWVQVLYLEDAFIQSMSFPLDDQTGYVANYATYTQPGGVWKTTDGGATWNFMTQGVTSVPVAIDFPVDTQYGLAVGFSGAILKTTDGGITWSEGSLAVSNTLEDVDLLNNNVGYAVGRGGLIAKTSDGGNPPIVSLYLHPTASGRINTFTGITGCSTDWDCVNDQSGNAGSGLPQAVNFADYIADGSGHRAMFALDNGVISANQTVSKICVSTAVTQETGPYASLSYQRVGIDTAPIDTPPFWMGNYWVTGIQTWCWSNLNWTATDLNALEIGVKTVNGEWLEVSQLYARVYTTAP